MNKQQLHIAKLISGYLSATLTPEEEKELKEWQSFSSENEELFKRICDAGNFGNYYRQSTKFNKQEGWEQFNRKIRFFQRRKYVLKFSRYAAVLLLPLIVGVLLYNTLTPTGQQTVAVQMQQQKIEILPGEKKAILTLSSGEVIDLKNTGDRTVAEEDGAAISIDSTALNYKLAQSAIAVEKEVYHKVEIPHGGEYSLTLSDGTQISLNSMTSLRFPVHFVGDKRVVELDGEAYFKVTKSSKPFIVKINHMEVEVLGTNFNVSAYQGEDYQTTLVDGSVKVKMATGSSCILKPSEQAYIKPGADDLNVRKVETSLYTSWVNGKIYFKDERLEDIMKSLSRWYEMDVFYSEPSVKNLRFGCNINRYTSIAPFLELLEKTGKVNIDIKGKTIIFKHNH